MNRVWEMFFTFSKFMTYLLTENASEQYYNLPNHVKDAVYQLLTATIYFLQKIQYKIDKNTDSSSLHLLIEQLISSELKPVDCQEVTSFPDDLLSDELKNEIKDPTQIVHEVRDESSELSHNEQKTGSEQCVELKNENEAFATVAHTNEGADLKVNDTCPKCPDDNETEILPEVYYKIQELILTTNELIDYLNERLGRQKIRNCKYTSRFNEIISCRNSQAFGENKTLHALQKEKKESNQNLLMQDSKENIIKILKEFSEDFQLNRDFSKIKKENLVQSSYLSVSSEQLEAIDLRKSFNNLMNKEKSESVLGICSTEQNASKKGNLQSGVGFTSALQAEATSNNEMEALCELKSNSKGHNYKNNSANGKIETKLQKSEGNFNGKKNGNKLFTENKQKSERSTNFIELGQNYNISGVLARGSSLQETKTNPSLVFSHIYEKFVKDVAKNTFRDGAFYCEPCKQIFTQEKKWKSHYNESSQHLNQISLQNSKVVLEKCDICKFAIVASNMVAKQHMLLHKNTHEELSASHINSRHSKAGKSDELDLKQTLSGNLMKNKMIKVEDLEKSFEEYESYNENCSEEDGLSVGSRPECEPQKYNNLRGTDPQSTNEFRSIFKCKQNFKNLNRILSGDRNSDAFYCGLCDVEFISKFKWNVHCSTFHFHQEAMNKEGNEHYEVRCKYCNLFVILPYNLIESYMKSHLRIHKIKNEEYKIMYSKKEQKHYFILNEFNDKLIQYCKDRKRKYFIKENVKTNEILGHILVNPNNNQPSEEEQNSMDIKKVQEEGFAGHLQILKRNHSPDVTSRDETGEHELVREQSPDVTTKNETGRRALSGENVNSTLSSSQRPQGVLTCSPEVLLYVNTALSERNKKVSNGLPLFLGLCLFCEKSCKTPLEWSYHLRNYRRAHAMKGVWISCFKCALIIHADPTENNLDELLSVTEHLCCQEIVKE